MTCFARAGLLLAMLAPVAALLLAADKPDAQSEFARTTIDLGTVVGNVENSVKFYTEAVGFKEIDGFEVPGDFCRDAGLTSGKKLSIRVLVLGEGESATKLKLMEVPGETIKKGDNAFVHSQFGFRYLTIYVNDTTAALARLSKAGVKPIAKGPVPLPKGLPEGVFLTIVRDPDGNLVELVGPRK